MKVWPFLATKAVRMSYGGNAGTMRSPVSPRINIIPLLFLQSHIRHSPPPSIAQLVRLTADHPIIHRKYLRISAYCELWAMKGRLSLHTYCLLSCSWLSHSYFAQANITFLPCHPLEMVRGYGLKQKRIGPGKKPLIVSFPCPILFTAWHFYYFFASIL